jgi:hypothetical protein
MSDTPQVHEVFRSANLVARAVTGLSADRCVVTFSPFEDNHALGRPGFEQGFLRRARVDAIHVIPRGNHAYQYADLPELCRQVAKVTSTYARIVAYGSSMGGYAAIRYGGWAGADVALALSPQFTLDPWRRPFDGRWPDHVRNVQFLHEHGRVPVRQAIVVYDPSDRYDDAHARLLRTLTHVIPVPLTGCGHPCTGLLADLGLLHPMALDVCDRTFAPDALIADFGRRCEESPQFHFVRASRTRDRNERYRLMNEAAARAPTHGGMILALAEAAIEVGLPEIALEALDRAHRAEPGRTQYLRSRAHEVAGRLEQAIEIMEDLCRPGTESPVYRAALRRLKRRQARPALIRRPWRSIIGR